MKNQTRTWPLIMGQYSSVCAAACGASLMAVMLLCLQLVIHQAIIKAASL